MESQRGGSRVTFYLLCCLQLFVRNIFHPDRQFFFFTSQTPACTSCKVSVRLFVFRHHMKPKTVNSINNTFMTNLVSISRVLTAGRTDGHDEVNSYVFANFNLLTCQKLSHCSVRNCYGGFFLNNKLQSSVSQPPDPGINYTRPREA